MGKRGRRLRAMRIIRGGGRARAVRTIAAMHPWLSHMSAPEVARAQLSRLWWRYALRNPPPPVSNRWPGEAPRAVGR